MPKKPEHSKDRWVPELIAKDGRLLLISSSLEAESDRGCAIFAAEILNTELEALLRALCLQDERYVKESVDPLFKGDAPLATFSARIRLAYAPVSTKITPGSRVFITPMDGFENYMAAAISKKKVPLVTVADKEHADYVITGTSVDKKAGWAKIVFMGKVHSDNAASVNMVDVKTGAIVFAYAVDKKSTMHGQQTTAEACAKHLKGHIEGKE
jgi:Mannitol repressor